MGYGAEGWTSIVVISLFLGGIQLLALAGIGEYMWRILEEVRARPLYFIRGYVGKFDQISDNRWDSVPNQQSDQ